jgi:uncharacterized protein DUF5916
LQSLRLLALCLAIACLFVAVPLFAAPEPNFGEITIPRVSRPPVLEDFLDMQPSPFWQGKLAKVDKFVQRTPVDGEPVSQPTEAYLGYDDKNLYTIFICFDKEPNKIRARLSRREDVFDDDSVELMLDTFHDHRRAYAFFSNPLGVQADGLWTEGQEWDFSFDTVFDTQAKVTDRGFIVLMSIPFRSLRFASTDPQTWGILLDRDVRRNNESSFWPQYSNRLSGRLNQEADALGLEQISPGRNLQLIPYGIFKSFKQLDLRDPFNPTFTQRAAFGQIGLDAKVVLKDKFVLDATANPDFSQVESDEPQVTVNQRFEVLFPEKRPFFLENANYFQTPVNLVFTRRIVDPKWGVRLTGKDGPWALGMLAAEDSAPGSTSAVTDQLFNKNAYFAIGRINRDLGSQSSLGAIFTDREVDGFFNRVGGLDTRIRMNSNWTAAGQAVYSSTYNVIDDNFMTTGGYQSGSALSGNLVREGRNLNVNVEYEDRSPNFRTLSGFDPQPDIRNLYDRVQYTFYPEGKHLISWTPALESYQTYDHEGNRINSGYFPSVKFELLGQTFLQVLYADEMERLRPQDFSSITSIQTYRRGTTDFSFDTSYYRPVSFHLDYRFGTRVNYDPPGDEIPFLAKRTSVNATLTVRPNKFLRVDNTYILFRLHNRENAPGALNFDVFRSKWNYQVTRRLSFRFIGEYTSVLANPSFTSVPGGKTFNADFLATYLVHPSTAVYIGYNSNLENVLLPLQADNNGNLLTGNNFKNDGRTLFVKLSYLFRF